jgi:GTP cyclohydrolase II
MRTNRVPAWGPPPSVEPVSALSPVSDQASAALQADRAGAELRRGRPIALRTHATPDPGEATPAAWLLAAVETLLDEQLHSLLATGAEARLLLSAERLQALGWPAASTARSMRLTRQPSLQQLQMLSAVLPGEADTSLLGDPQAADAALHAALLLCKRARLIPAVLLLALDRDQAAALDGAQLMQVRPEELASAAPLRRGLLRRVSDARVPIAAHEDCTLVLFRELDSDAEHVAVIVGQPAADEPVPVRLHSSCLTGDLLDSLRCDCGPQLQTAIERLAETGGVLLYLAQEGRGTGLANKLRAYRLQDRGLDTLQADRHLGFREDERDFQPAAAMLRALGYQRIRLLTNNPQKIEALRQAGIEVVDRLPLHGPVNHHNARYISTKRTRGGHLGVDD